MARRKEPRLWTRRQREQFRHWALYIDYFKEKVDGYRARNQIVPALLESAIELLPDIRRRIEADRFESSAELWRELESRVVEWHLHESKHWRPDGRRPSDFQPH